MKSDLSRQQKLWAAGTAVIRAFRPAMLYLLLPSVLMGIGMFFGNRTAAQITRESGSFYYAVGALFCLWFFFKRRREQVFEEIALTIPEANRNSGKKLVLLACMGLCISLGISAVLTLLSRLGWLWSDYTASTRAAYNGYDRLLVIITNIILSPIMEELVFRGFMIRRLEGWFSRKQAVLISTAFFAICHVNPVWVFYAFAMGLMLAWVALKEENIFYSMTFHMGFNLAALPVSLINGSAFWNQLLFGSWWKVGMIGAGAGTAAVFIYRCYVKEEKGYD